MVANTILLLQLLSTLPMVGLIWFVQIVHYPLFNQVGTKQFPSYHRIHQTRTTLVVAPLMITEAVTALALPWFPPPGIPISLPLLGLTLVILIWLSTALLQVPAHRQLAQKFNPQTHRHLVQTNWIRTTAWTLRALLLSWICLQHLNSQ